jgi:hypothetical protein
MQIDRSNYEIWLIDWLDGNLSNIQIEQLQDFLRENPDLKEEFDEHVNFRLNPSGKSFQHKTNLKKTTANLSWSQFEYLSVAYLENDLSADQQTELKESIELDPLKKRSFELIQKMKLSPAALTYKHKKRLLRRTVAQNVIRLSLIGLSAAAIITLVVMTYNSKPGELQVKFEKTAQIILADSIIQKPSIEKVSDKIQTVRKIIPFEKQSKNLYSFLQKNASDISETNTNLLPQNDSLVRYADLPLSLFNKITFTPEINLKRESIPNTLIALKYKASVPADDDERSKLSRFIAKTFREKLLKEKTPKDSPLKVYEIIEASVSGLDKLFGWEMALDERKDDNGELKSVYFSSKILNFNAPIKKSEPLR